MGKDQKVSIIVPVYKVEEYLAECIDSILAQTYSDIEVLLVDDGSPDHCGDICDRYAEKDPRIVVVHQENGGVTSARRVGVERATGEWISFVDGDDTLPPDAIEILINASEGHDCVRGTCFTDRKIQFPSHRFPILSSEACVKYILNSLFLPTLCIGIYRKPILEKNEIFQIPSSIVHSEDTLSLIKIILNLDHVRYVDEIVYNYRLREDSVTHTFVPNYDYERQYDDCLRDIFRKRNYMELFHKELFRFRISFIRQLMNSRTMKMRNEYVKRIKNDHRNTPKSIGQQATLLIAGFPYWLRKPLYRVYSKMNSMAYDLNKRK